MFSGVYALAQEQVSYLSPPKRKRQLGCHWFPYPESIRCATVTTITSEIVRVLQMFSEARLYNSFGSFRERSGTSFGQIAPVGRFTRTVVLINGPSTRQPIHRVVQSTNSIPLSAVVNGLKPSRIHASVYRADALGGVINFIMKDDYEGAEILLIYLQTVLTKTAFRLFGASGDQGRVTASVEWYTRDPIFDGDRLILFRSMDRLSATLWALRWK